MVLALLVAACEQSSNSRNQSRSFAKNCPVVGNSNTRIYHVPGDRNYGQMLEENTRTDNRVCFQSTSEAENAGYQRSRSGSRKWWHIFS